MVLKRRIAATTSNTQLAITLTNWIISSVAKKHLFGPKINFMAPICWNLFRAIFFACLLLKFPSVKSNQVFELRGSEQICSFQIVLKYFGEWPRACHLQLYWPYEGIQQFCKRAHLIRIVVIEFEVVEWSLDDIDLIICLLTWIRIDSAVWGRRKCQQVYVAAANKTNCGILRLVPVQNKQLSWTRRR